MHIQPKCVIYYIKIIFAVVPIALSIISFYFKTKYPIKEEYNILIKNGIEIQKNNFDLMKRDKINYYKINNPVYNTEHINILPNTNEVVKNSIKTKDLCEHFYSKKDLMMIYKGDLEILKKKNNEKNYSWSFLMFYIFCINII